MNRSMKIAAVAALAAAGIGFAVGAGAHETHDGDGWINSFGRYHPAVVHFPLALVVAAGIAELLYATRKKQYFGDAARFMISLAAWLSIPAAVLGLMTAAGRSYGADLSTMFSYHRIAGIALPVLTFLAAGLCEGTRRSGQVWEQMLYRAILALAVLGALAAGHYGARLVYGPDYFPL